MTSQNDIQIIEQERKGHRRAMTVLPAAALALLTVAIATYWALSHGLLPHWMGPASLVGFLVGLSGTVLIIFLLRLVASAPKEAKSERILRKQIDDHNQRAQYLYLLLAGSIALDAWALPASDLPVPGADVSAWVSPAGFAFAILGLGALVCFGPCFMRTARRRALNDEWTRAMRGRAATIGYMLSVAALGAIYLVSLYRPEWNSAVLPPIMAGVVVIPTFVFLTQQWRAGRGES